jgi:large subunit ribosomal protein L15
VVNLGRLDAFEAGTIVTPELLREHGLIKARLPLKVLGKGALTKPLTVRAHRFSAGAQQAITQAGGTAEVIEG